MDKLLADNEQALKQRIVHQKLKEQEFQQAERLQRMRKTEQEIRREATWFKIGFISIGILIGVPIGGLFTQVNSDVFQKVPLLSQPLEQQ